MYRKKDLRSSVTLSQGNVKECVRQALVLVEQAKVCMKRSATHSSYAGYTPEERAKIERYGADENGPARATRHFAVHETTTRRLKSKYLQKLEVMQHSENVTVVVKSLTAKTQGRHPLLGC